MTSRLTDPLSRARLLPEEDLPSGAALIAEGASLAETWRVGASAFLDHYGVACEAAYKRRAMAEHRVMCHSQVGYRALSRTEEALARLAEAAENAGGRVDRAGICLDWSMGYRRGERQGRPLGTGLLLEEPEDFAKVAAAAPIACHFGDFVLGFPAALENTQAALAAGATTIGNLGQYFTFRLPHWDDDVASTAETVKALALIAAQPVEVLVHSNLDDGFAATFTDLSTALGGVLVERHIVETLLGAKLAVCFGHHFSEPLTRLAFQRALARVHDTPGSMLYGNTTSYRGDAAANYASLSAYLLTDILSQRLMPSGHAVNPVPVSENERIPDIDELLDAQAHARRIIDRGAGYESMIDLAAVDAVAERIQAGGEIFFDRLMAGLGEAGIDTRDPFEMLLALRRAGSARLEALYGAGDREEEAPRGRRALVPASTTTELAEAAAARLAAADPALVAAIREAGLCVLSATTDVHEHGKMLLDRVLAGLGVTLVEGGVSSDPDDLAKKAAEEDVDAIAISTYNGVALRYFEALRDDLARENLALPVFIGGRLNQIPAESNTALPVDVGADLEAAGAKVCRDVDDMIQGLGALIEERKEPQA